MSILTATAVVRVGDLSLFLRHDDPDPDDAADRDLDAAAGVQAGIVAGVAS